MDITLQALCLRVNLPPPMCPRSQSTFIALLSFALFLSSARADTIAVFAKDQIALAQSSGSTVIPNENPSRQHFISALSAGEKSGTFDETLPIVTPPEWGRTVPGSGGEVSYRREFAQGFAMKISLKHLLPRHSYVLCLNGTPNHPGNDLFVDGVPGLPNERYFDFLHVGTNEQGDFEAPIGVYLLPGNYHARIYVKDTVDSKIVLYRDFIDFVVKPDSN